MLDYVYPKFYNSLKKFLTIGLPWALSLSGVFYFGLHLGSSNINQPPAPTSTIGTVDRDLKSQRLNTALRTTDQRSQDNIIQIPSQFSNPTLPPNLERIMEGGDLIERMGAYLDAVRAMDQGNAQSVVGAFEALPKGYGRHLEMKLLMRSWAAIDPEAALQYANDSLDPKSERRFGISEALAGWANRDSQSALEWARANNLNKNPGDNPLLLGVIKGIAEKNLDSANQILKSLPEGSARWQASTFLAQQYAESGFEQAIEWANQFPKEDERMRETILGQMGARLARQDLSATAEWVKSMKKDEASLRVMDNLLTQWVTKDAQAASQWIDEIEEEEKRYYGMKQLTSRWALRDPIATAEWLNSFPPKLEMDPVVNEFVNRISTRDPEGAAGWALSIVDPKAKEKAVTQAVSAWKRSDPEKASAWQKENFPNIK
jgi:hypothetical protein